MKNIFKIYECQGWIKGAQFKYTKKANKAHKELGLDTTKERFTLTGYGYNKNREELQIEYIDSSGKKSCSYISDFIMEHKLCKQ